MHPHKAGRSSWNNNLSIKHKFVNIMMSHCRVLPLGYNNKEVLRKSKLGLPGLTNFHGVNGSSIVIILFI